MSGLLIDAAVQPFCRDGREIYDYMDEVNRDRGFPDVESQWYQAPGGDYDESLYGKGYPGSDPEIASRHLFEDDGVDVAILNPRTRGNLPDFQLNTAVCSASNRWLAHRWLDEGNPHGRFRGTIRVNPEDVPGSVAEIERWGDHPLMVQVGVPLQSRDLYGRPRFYPIWAAAAEAGLPICISTNGGAGLEYPPTPTGHARTYSQYIAFMAYNYVYHLLNILTEPLFKEVPGAVFVFSDGGAEQLTPFIWKLDTLWLGVRDQTPWVDRPPSEYLKDHVRLGFSRLDKPPGDSVPIVDWLAQTGKEDVVMYASNYPFWWRNHPDDLYEGTTKEQTEKVRWRNAGEVYRGVTAEAA